MQELDALNKKLLPSHKFTYDERLPCLNSLRQDHWGFLNNNPAQTLLPTLKTLIYGRPAVVWGANREVSAYVTAGMLKEITYPTGGTTTFEFESNDYGYVVDKRLTELEMVYEDFAVEDVGDGESVPVSVTFSVNKEQFVQVYHHFTLANSYLSDQNDRFVRIINLANQAVVYLHTASGSNAPFSGVTDMLLQPGQYKMEAMAVASGDIARVLLTVGNETTEIKKKKLGGGVRIRRMTDHDGIDSKNDIVKEYVYEIQNGSGVSSGSIMNEPQYEHTYKEEKTVPDPNQEQQTIKVVCTFKARSASNSAPLITLGGNIVAYSQVVELHGQGGENGKTIYNFHSPLSHPDTVNKGFPFGLSTSYDFRRGQLKEQINFKKTTSGYQKINKTSYVYKFVPEVITPINGIKLGVFVKRRAWTVNDPGEFVQHTYHYVAEWVHLVEETQVTYDQNDESKFITQTTKHFYENTKHRQRTRTESTDSEGNLIISEMKYPLDYQIPTGVTLTGTAAVIGGMQNANIVGNVIESVVYKRINNVNHVISGTLATYKSIFGNPFAMDQEFKFETDKPVIATGFTKSAISGNAFIMDSRYKAQASFKYGVFNNLQEQSAINNISISYLWGYQNTLPLAQVVNASAARVFFTSFEEEAVSTTIVTGNARTGEKSRRMTTAYTLPVLPAGTYTRTYWFQTATNSAWQLKQEQVTSNGTTALSITITGITAIDEVRIYPVDAQMSTYTYQHMVGMTSATDANNITTYYEYDSAGRLKCIRDQDKNILKTYEYRYHRQ